MRVLVVEDELPLCEVFGEFLRGLGHHTLIAHTAEAALETLDKERPDAVLLDIFLPGMSGLEFLQERAARAADVPVVAMSGVATEAQARECLRLGAVEFVGKPVVLERLGELVAGIEQRRRRRGGVAVKSPERRRSPRAEVSLPVHLRDERGVEWDGTTVDVSAVGALIRPERRVRAGSLVTLSMILPDGPDPLEIAAVRARHDDDTDAYDFLEATEAQRARLRGLVARFTWVEARQPDPHVHILHTIAQAIGASLDVTAVLDTALDALTHVTGHEISSLHLLSPDGTTLRLHGARGLSGRLRELNQVLPVGEGMIGTVVATGVTRHYADAATAPDLLPAARAIVSEEGIRAFVCVAVQSRGRILGALSLGRRQRRTFSDDEIELVEASANQIALALENAKLYAETRQQLEGLKLAETQLVEGERLSTLGKLAAGIAHEINNPLTTILGQAEMLLTRNAVAPEAIDRVRIIIEETSRSARLLRSMLRLARRQRPERRLCSIEEQVQLVLTLQAHDLRQAGIEVVTSFAPVPPVWADEDQVRQVLLNLVQNAQHAMARGNRARVLTVRVVGLDGRARIEIADTGPGIAPEALPRLFDAFFTTKPAGEGTGLGLWVSYGIIEQHDGTLRAENRPDGGAVFTIELPYGQRATDTPPATPAR
ncbi:MAG: response regulator [Candidatus Rokubacteria bacterium]|nr:response regulator [Candidatus Rokubacteria bacterium]